MIQRTLLAAVVFPLRLIGFWVLFFTAYRLGFLCVFYDQWQISDSGSTPAALWHALPLDLSAAGYLSAFPVLLWHLAVVQRRAFQIWTEKAIAALALLFIVLQTGILVANLFIYSEWRTLLNNRALEYLKTPESLYESLSVPRMIFIAVLFALLAWLMWRMYRAVVGVRVFPERIRPWAAAGFPVQVAVLALLIRGGLGVMPINESAVYYSNRLFDNHAATNVPWHLLHSMVETRAGENHYRFMPDAAAAARRAALLPADTALLNINPNLLKQDSVPPNVVLIIMEGLTAQIVEELQGEPDISPHLGALIREGVLFDRCYSSGYRTDQGLISVLAGFPALPDQSVVLLEDKAVQLNSVPRVLKQHGYNSSFYYGGELTFANIGVWLTHQGYDYIRSGKDFPADERLQRWGADDGRLFEKAVRELAAAPQPFLSTILTLSLHPPFDVPVRGPRPGARRVDQFRNSAIFADAALGRFFQAVRQQPWYSNTLFVLVADHGNGLPGDIGGDQPLARHIPLVFTGPAVAEPWRGKRVSTVGGHHDLPATLLAALGIRSEFPWSRSLWPTHPPAYPSAYYTNEDGIGWVTPQGAGFYDFKSKKWRILQGQLSHNQQLDAQAWLQCLYADFILL